jgi:hypothetical protein
MRLATEEINKSVKILFIFKKKIPLIQLLKNKLAQYQYEIFSSVILPERIDQFNYVFLFNEKQITRRLALTKSPIIIILINQRKQIDKLLRLLSSYKIHNAKIINIDDQLITNETLEKIIWFIVSKSKEKSLNLEKIIRRKLEKKENKQMFPNLHMTKRKLLIIFCAILFLAESFFILPLLGTGFFLYKSLKEFESEEYQHSRDYLYYSRPLFYLAKKTYSLSRPILSFFYLALLPDDIISIEENSYSLLQIGLETMENGRKIIPLILKSDNAGGKKELLMRLDKLKNQLDKLTKTTTLISQKMKFNIKGTQGLKSKLIEVEETINQFKKIFFNIDEILGKNGQKKYLLLFQNNMELRPGGGFIGSFGNLTFADYRLKDLKIEDVYEADGQLKAHIEPPPAIKKYFNQPHWFLRDSNFSPDFEVNFQKAKFFLEKEMGLTDFDGAIGITTTAINYLLDAFGDIYLSDYNEKINKDNFYIKTQIYSEKNFFPGSIQKKAFLSSLVKTLLIKLEDVSYKKLTYGLERSLTEKQIVLYFTDKNIQKEVTLSGWSGKLVAPKCMSQLQNCIIDNFFPIDANLGVNKANFFISRLINSKVKITESGKVENLLSISFKNDSPAEIFPGGTYKNFFQTYLPKDSTITQVTKDGVLVDNYKEENEGQFNIVSLYFEIPPKKIAEIKLAYHLKEKLSKGKNIYQLVIQKQIGSDNNDLILEFYFPKNVYIINRNFSSLAKDNSLIYNTNLSTDRIFFIELVRE